MTDASNSTEEKSFENLAFVHWLRTGQSLSADEMQALQERKYNHNHDDLGRFASTGGGATSHSAMYHAPPPRPIARSAGAPAPKPPGTATPTRPAATSTSTPTRQEARPAQTATGQGGHSLQREGYTPWTQVGSHPARVYRTKSGAAIIDPRSGRPMLVPQGVSIRNTLRFARVVGQGPNREGAAMSAFGEGGAMDFQRNQSTLRDRNGGTVIDQRFVAIGNYNFGVYAAASGMTLAEALAGARTRYLFATFRGLVNTRNESLLVRGYHDYLRSDIGD